MGNENPTVPMKSSRRSERSQDVLGLHPKKYQQFVETIFMQYILSEWFHYCLFILQEKAEH